jgi:ribosomal protein S18 acetylase RimI-like enzyme
MGAMALESRFRIADPADVPILLEMMAEFNHGEGISWTAARGEAPLRRLLADPTLGAVGLIEAGHTIVGYSVVTWGYDLEWDGRDAFLTEIYLRPSARRRGLGRALLRAVERTASEAGARALHLMVRHDNPPALRLYEQASYVTPPRRFMTKLLSG